ncbi:MAG TPA: hypothetical protein VIS51_04325 [Solirubrobacterales bacterium]
MSTVDLQLVHPLRALKAGDLRLEEVYDYEELLEERLLDLIGFALIGRGGQPRADAPTLALSIARVINVGPLLQLRECPRSMVAGAAQAVQDA